MTSAGPKLGMFSTQRLPGSPRSQAAVLFALALCTVTFLLFEYEHLPTRATAWVPERLLSSLPTDPISTSDLPASAVGTARKLRKWCAAPDEYERRFGRANLRRSRGYEGSLARTHRFLGKALRGEPITVAAIGGSVTKGHHIYDSETWISLLRDWLADRFPHSDVNAVNGAIPASGSDYFSFCMKLHIPEEADLVVVELGVNDEALPEHEENMENLLRGLLDLPNQPAVMLLEVVAFSQGEMAGGGYRKHLPIAQYYDVPVINQRHPLVTHWARFPELLPWYFTENFWHYPDKRHMNSRGHADASRLVQSLLRDALCEGLDDPDVLFPPKTPMPVERSENESFDERLRAAYGNTPLEAPARWGIEQRPWSHHVDADFDKGVPESDNWYPGMFTPPPELGRLPRLSALEKWNPHVDHALRPWHPTCYSARSPDPAYNITPTLNEGWRYWVHEDHKDKPFFIADQPGAKIQFELETTVGLVKLYSLRSREYGLGNLKCWVEGREDKAVTVVGFWDRSENIGRFATIAEGLPEGKHTVTCELLSESKDPGGGTNFRLIAVMSV